MKITKLRLRQLIEEEIIKEDTYAAAERREMGGPDYRGYPGHASSGPYDRYGDGIKYGTREYFIEIKGLSPEQADRAVQNLEDQRAAQDEANAEWRAMEKKQDEVSDRRHAAEIRKKMKQYPPKEPLRSEIADLLARFPEGGEELSETMMKITKRQLRRIINEELSFILSEKKRKKKKDKEGKCPESGCIHKDDDGDDGWEIESNITGKDWPANYKTKKRAMGALAAYHVDQAAKG